MALNWFLTLRNLSKTDSHAAEIMENLKKAETDEEKEYAKQQAQAYLQEIQSTKTDPEESKVVSENKTVDETQNQPITDENDNSGNEENKKTCPEETPKELTDLSAPAFNPRLARYGITREEELFLHGVFVRKMTRDEKLLMRRSIYNKKTVAASKIQAEFKAKRIEQKQKDANDPEKQKYHQERKYISAIVNALEQHKNLGYIFTDIDGLTIDIFRELIKKPCNVNAFNQANPNFVTNFKKKYGE